MKSPIARAALMLCLAAAVDILISAQEAARVKPLSNPPIGNAVLVRLFDPVYPPLARQADVSGEVRIAVTVAEDGTAKAAVESGHAMLIQAALDSAKNSRFACQHCDAPATYSLVYTFTLNAGPDCCSAFSVPPKVQQSPETVDEQGQKQTQMTIAAEHLCICDPSVTLMRRVKRSWKCLYLWKCSTGEVLERQVHPPSSE